MLQRSNSTGAQQAFVVRTDWAQFHGNDAAHTGYNRFENTISTANAANLEALWTVPIGPTGTWSTPVIAGGKVYIGGLDGKLYGFNATTGAPSLGFPRTLGGPVQHSTAAVGFGNVYVGTGAPDGKLYAFDAATGSTVAGFPKQVGFAAYSPPALALGNVYVAEFNGNLWAFAATNGAAVPGFPKTVLNGAFGAPAISGGLVFVASRDGLLYAFDALTGNATATSPKDLGSSAMSTPVLANQQDFVTTTEGNLNYLRGLDRDLESNGTIFPLDLGNESPNNYRTPAIGGGLIVVGKPANGFTAFRPNQGFAPVWGQAFFYPVRSSPIIANGVVFMNSSRVVYALDAASGATLWSSSVRTAEFASPAVANGIAYIASTDGFLYAYSENGVAPSARLAGGDLGVRPALSGLKPDLNLKPTRSLH